MAGELLRTPPRELGEQGSHESLAGHGGHLKSKVKLSMRSNLVRALVIG